MALIEIFSLLIEKNKNSLFPSVTFTKSFNIGIKSAGKYTTLSFLPFQFFTKIWSSKISLLFKLISSALRKPVFKKVSIITRFLYAKNHFQRLAIIVKISLISLSSTGKGKDNCTFGGLISRATFSVIFPSSFKKSQKILAHFRCFFFDSLHKLSRKIILSYRFRNFLMFSKSLIVQLVYSKNFWMC